MKSLFSSSRISIWRWWEKSHRTWKLFSRLRPSWDLSRTYSHRKPCSKLASINFISSRRWTSQGILHRASDHLPYSSAWWCGVENRVSLRNCGDAQMHNVCCLPPHPPHPHVLHQSESFSHFRAFIEPLLSCLPRTLFVRDLYCQAGWRRFI